MTYINDSYFKLISRIESLEEEILLTLAKLENDPWSVSDTEQLRSLSKDLVFSNRQRRQAFLFWGT